MVETGSHEYFDSLVNAQTPGTTEHITAISLQEAFMSDRYAMVHAQGGDYLPEQSLFVGARMITRDSRIDNELRLIQGWTGLPANTKQKTLDAHRARITAGLNHGSAEYHAHGRLYLATCEQDALAAAKSEGRDLLAAIFLREDPSSHRYHTELIYPKAYIEVAQFAARSLLTHPAFPMLRETITEAMPKAAKLALNPTETLGRLLAGEMTRQMLIRESDQMPDTKQKKRRS
jgi:hypothetical protein